MAHRWCVKRPPVRLWLSLALLLPGVSGHLAGASAAERVACSSLNMGELDMVPASGAGTLRAVEMNEGDTLEFTFGTDSSVRGTITLVAGDGREQRLRFGPDARQVSYRAEQAGVVDVRLATQHREITALVTTCNPASPAPASMTPEGLHVDMSIPLLFGVTAGKEEGAPAIPTSSLSNLQWLGDQQSGPDAAKRYGINLKLQPALMVGVLAQFDPAGKPLLGPAALSDQPWLAGPVTSLQLGPGLSLDARAAWGSADPAAGHAADRQTLDARLTSKQEAGPWRFSPSVGFAHWQERVGTPAEHSAELPGPQTLESTRFDITPELAYRIDMGRSTYIEPRIVVGTFWNLGDAAAGTTTGAQHEARHMAEGGITFGAADGTKLQVGGGVEEGPTRAENVWSGRLQLNIPLK